MNDKVEVSTFWRWKPVPGQTYSNRARYHVRRLIHERGIMMGNGTESVSGRMLYKFTLYGGDMTISKLAALAEDLGVKFETLIRPYPGEDDE